MAEFAILETGLFRAADSAFCVCGESRFLCGRLFVGRRDESYVEEKMGLLDVSRL